MKPDTPDDLDDFAAQLFAAARAERSAPPLLERVLRASSEASAGAPERQQQPEWRPTRLDDAPRRKRRRSVGWISLTAALPVAAAIAIVLETPGDAPRISREGARQSPVGSSPPQPASELDPSHLPEPAPAAPEPTLVNPEVTRPPVTPPRSAPPDRPEREASPETPSGTPIPLSSELEVLKQAREALRQGNGESALRLLDRYDSERGVTLVAEATLLRIETLSSLGQAEAARDLAQRFVRENPDSPLVDRARRFTGDSKDQQ